MRTALYRFYINYKIKARLKVFDTCSPEALPVIANAFKVTRGLEGDYFEFGLFKGFTLYHAFKTASQQDIDCRFFGFDSFEGLPEISDLDQGAKFDKGKYACDLNTVRNNLSKNEVDLQKTYLIKGFFSDTLRDTSLKARYPFGKARIVMVDCDLYASTKDVLDFIHPYLQNGTILIMDDWNCFDADDAKGERLATREFLAAHPEISLEHFEKFGWHGDSFKVALKQ